MDPIIGAYFELTNAKDGRDRKRCVSFSRPLSGFAVPVERTRRGLFQSDDRPRRVRRCVLMTVDEDVSCAQEDRSVRWVSARVEGELARRRCPVEKTSSSSAWLRTRPRPIRSNCARAAAWESRRPSTLTRCSAPPRSHGQRRPPRALFARRRRARSFASSLGLSLCALADNRRSRLRAVFAGRGACAGPGRDDSSRRRSRGAIVVSHTQPPQAPAVETGARSWMLARAAAPRSKKARASRYDSQIAGGRLFSIRSPGRVGPGLGAAAAQDALLLLSGGPQVEFRRRRPRVCRKRSLVFSPSFASRADSARRGRARSRQVFAGRRLLRLVQGLLRKLE